MKQILLSLFVLFSIAAIAQNNNPFESIGKESAMLTLSNGRYEEVFKNEKLRRVGSVMMNTETMKIDHFLTEEELKECQDLETEKQASRFLSVDPLARSFPFYTPYQYAGNMPIQAIDIEGLEPGIVNFLPELALRLYGFKQKLTKTTSDHIKAQTGTGDFNNERIPEQTRKINNALVTMNAQKVYGEAFLAGAETTAEVVNTIPGVDIVGDPLLAGYYGRKGDYESAAAYTAAIAVPGISGLALKGGSKGLRYMLKNTDLDLRGTDVAFRDALETAFEKTGVAKENFNVTKWSKNEHGKSFPVEFRAKGGAEVSIDLPHTNNGPDAPHIGWQTPGKRGSGEGQRGHIILDDVPAGR